MNKAPRILVVDDEPKICDFLEILLKREGYRVETATDPAAALDLFGRGEFDLVISDLKMPGMDGFELSRRIRLIDADVPLVIVTGYATINTAIQALREGFDDFVTKPFKLEEMRKVVARALEKTRLKLENQRLMEELKEANKELAEHRAALLERVDSAHEELRRTNEDLRRRVESLAMINKIGERAAEELDIESLLNSCADQIVERLGATKVAIMLTEGDELVVRACRGEGGKRTLGRRSRLYEGVAGVAVRTGEPILIGDVKLDRRFKPGKARDCSSGSLICMPIVYNLKNLGVLSVMNNRAGARFTDDDVKLLGAIVSQIAPSVENAALCRKLEESSYSSVRALVAAVEAKDRYTSGHSMRVTQYAMMIGEALGLPDEEMITLERAGQLHDLGKLGIADQLLNKPAALTGEEYGVVKQHPKVGEQIIEPLRFLSREAAAIRHHHERPDGKGYPDGLKGEEIGVMSRILSVADAFDAMTSPRPYRPPKDFDEAVEEIASLSGAQFDTEIARIFCEKVFPASRDKIATA